MSTRRATGPKRMLLICWLVLLRGEQLAEYDDTLGEHTPW